MKARKLYKLSLVLMLILSLIVCLLLYFLYTSHGLIILVEKVLPKYVKEVNISIGEIKGSLVKGARFSNVEITEIKRLPIDSMILIQGIDVSLSSLTYKGINLNINNARIRLPDSEQIVLFGSLRQGYLNFNLYTQNFGVDQVIDFIPDKSKFSGISGTITNIDIFLKGLYSQPKIYGKFYVDNLSREGFVLKQCPGEVDIQIKDFFKNSKIKGNITFTGGIASSKRTEVNLNESSIKFSPVSEIPELNVSGFSKIDRVEINITLKGPINEPEINLSSDLPLSEEKLLVMLVTGKRWKSMESEDSGEISADLAKDFIDYFIFSGKGQKIAERFGISEISIQYDEYKQGIGVKKEISNKLEVGYDVEQTQVDSGKESSIKQKVQGEYKVTEKILLGVEKELKEAGGDSLDNSTDDGVAEEKVFLKFKTKF